MALFKWKMDKLALMIVRLMRIIYVEYSNFEFQTETQLI